MLLGPLSLLSAPAAGDGDMPALVGPNAAMDHAPFTLPFLNHFVEELTASRVELERIIIRRRFREMPWDDAAKVNLKSTEMPTELIIRDLVGTGRVQIAAQTTAGRILRVASAL